MKTKKIYAILILSMLSISCWAAKKTEKENPPKITIVNTSKVENAVNDAIVYYLPKTVLKIEVEAEQVILKKGPFYRYSERYLGVKDVITEDNAFWKINGLRVTSVAIPDPEKGFVIITEDGQPLPALNLTPSGLIQSYNCEVPKIEIEKIIKTEEPVNVDTTFGTVPLLEDQLISISSAKMAEELAKTIYTLRQIRIAIITGESSQTIADGKALEISLEKIQELELQYLSMFVGKEFRIKKSFTIMYEPKTGVDKDIAFRFSKFSGVVDKDDVSGSPVFISMTKTFDPLLLASKPLLPERDSKGNVIKPSPVEGLVYNKPSSVKLTLIEGVKAIFTSEMPIAQLGITATLPGESLHNHAITFDVETGALINISPDTK